MNHLESASEESEIRGNKDRNENNNQINVVGKNLEREILDLIPTPFVDNAHERKLLKKKKYIKRNLVYYKSNASSNGDVSNACLINTHKQSFRFHQKSVRCAKIFLRKKLQSNASNVKRGFIYALKGHCENISKHGQKQSPNEPIDACVKKNYEGSHGRGEEHIVKNIENELFECQITSPLKGDSEWEAEKVSDNDTKNVVVEERASEQQIIALRDENDESSNGWGEEKGVFVKNPANTVTESNLAVLQVSCRSAAHKNTNSSVKIFGEIKNWLLQNTIPEDYSFADLVFLEEKLEILNSLFKHEKECMVYVSEDLNKKESDFQGNRTTARALSKARDQLKSMEMFVTNLEDVIGRARKVCDDILYRDS